MQDLSKGPKEMVSLRVLGYDGEYVVHGHVQPPRLGVSSSALM